MSVGIRRTLHGLPSLLVFSTSLREYRACYHSQRPSAPLLHFTSPLSASGEDLPRFVQVAAGEQQPIDLGPIFGPLLDLVEIAVIRNQRRLVSSADWLIAVRSYFAGRRRMSS